MYKLFKHSRYRWDEKPTAVKTPSTEAESGTRCDTSQ